MSKHKIHVGQRVTDSDGREGFVLSINEYPFSKSSKAVARVQYRTGEQPEQRFVYVDWLVPAPQYKPEPVTAKLGDRVRDIHGKEGVVFQTGMTGLNEVEPNIPVASVRYHDGAERCNIYTDSLTVLPKEEVKSGDRVRHIADIDPVYRRTNGTAVGSILSDRASISVLWPGGVLRTELLSQLEVTRPAEAEDNSTTVGQALELLRDEYRATAGKIEDLQAYKDSLGVAIDALVEVVAR